MTRTFRLLALAAAFVSLVAPASAQGADVHVVEAGETLYRISRAHGLTVERLQELNGLTGTIIEIGQRLRLNERVPMPARPVPAPVASPGRAPDSSAQPSEVPRTPRNRTPSDRPPPSFEPLPDEPPSPAPPPLAGSAQTHVVQPGETLFRIALIYDVTVEDLRRLNEIDGDEIRSGQRLVISGAATSSGSAAVALGAADEWSITQTTVAADLVHFVEPGETLYSIAAALGLGVDELARENAISTAPLPPGTALVLPQPIDPSTAAQTKLPPPDEDGLALVYPDVMRGRQTASGEPYDPLGFTVSHRDHPLGTLLLVTNPASGRSTFVRVTDRGPVSRAYLVELSAAAATALALDPNAARRVELRRVP